MQGIEIVFFDAGNTLVHTRESQGEVYTRAARRQGLAVEVEDVVAAFHDAFDAHKQDGRLQDREWWRAVVYDTFDRFGRAASREALFDELFDYFTAPSSWCLHEDALTTVDRVRERGYRVGLISNWDERLGRLLRDLDLTPRLDPILISAFVGAEKPDPAIFRAALEAADARPESACMVGDEVKADVLGARAVGMHAVHLRRDGGPVADGPHIHSLLDLLDVLPVRSAHP